MEVLSRLLFLSMTFVIFMRYINCGRKFRQPDVPDTTPSEDDPNGYLDRSQYQLKITNTENNEVVFFPAPPRPPPTPPNVRMDDVIIDLILERMAKGEMSGEEAFSNLTIGGAGPVPTNNIEWLYPKGYGPSSRSKGQRIKPLRHPNHRFRPTSFRPNLDNTVTEGRAKGNRGRKGNKGDKGARGTGADDENDGDEDGEDGGARRCKCKRGHRGRRGPQGLKGDRGEVGEKGGKGDRGLPGMPGPQGPPGPQSFIVEGGQAVDAGIPGPPGTPGPVGPFGPKGEQGSPGMPGFKGAVGPTGPQGPQGPQGEKGRRGRDGIPGLVIFPTEDSMMAESIEGLLAYRSDIQQLFLRDKTTWRQLKVSRCGDGIVDAQDGEECDDGNDIISDGCADCYLAYCGDGLVYRGVEECDGNDFFGATCSTYRPGYVGDLGCNSECRIDYSNCRRGD